MRHSDRKKVASITLNQFKEAAKRVKIETGISVGHQKLLEILSQGFFGKPFGEAVATEFGETDRDFDADTGNYPAGEMDGEPQPYYELRLKIGESGETWPIWSKSAIEGVLKLLEKLAREDPGAVSAERLLIRELIPKRPLLPLTASFRRKLPNKSLVDEGRAIHLVALPDTDKQWTVRALLMPNSISFEDLAVTARAGLLPKKQRTLAAAASITHLGVLSEDLTRLQLHYELENISDIETYRKIHDWLAVPARGCLVVRFEASSSTMPDLRQYALDLADLLEQSQTTSAASERLRNLLSLASSYSMEQGAPFAAWDVRQWKGGHVHSIHAGNGLTGELEVTERYYCFSAVFRVRDAMQGLVVIADRGDFLSDGCGHVGSECHG